MANPTINRLTKRGFNLLIGALMFVTSILLIVKVHVSFAEILYTLNPYPFYFLGLIFGAERLFYSITGSTKLFSLMTGSGEFSSFTSIAIFLFLLSFGLYVLAYSFLYTSPFLIAMNALNGLSFLLYSLSLFKAWHI
ncbi:hypothetical protein [Stygiolobus caldivivus]|uniref:Uncharacterized protein n=1 Tax=Stygiolobus caldivivus TaxID=2824673 RepID=A0A8D5U4L9_9CREN|nr:hypothetical protein [Stygiolobus caldivivus]BCU69168.1 hypothetical protein KN1_04650 [Stygiolobus caldivivus]